MVDLTNLITVSNTPRKIPKAIRINNAQKEIRVIFCHREPEPDQRSVKAGDTKDAVKAHPNMTREMMIDFFDNKQKDKQSRALKAADNPTARSAAIKRSAFTCRGLRLSWPITVMAPS